MSGLEAQHVGFAYGGRPAVRDVSLQAVPGEVLGLIGPNGAGKTTLLRLLAGLLHGTGTVHYDGIPAAQLSARQRAQRRAFVGQGIGSSLPYRVGEIVGMGGAHRHPLFMAPAGPSAIAAALDEAGCQVDPQRSFSELSGGEKQQVLLARALVQRPPMLLLDEPSSYLDLRHQRALAVALRRRAKAGAVVVVSLHDLNLAAGVCDRLVLLRQGQIVAHGPPHDVLRGAVLQPVYETSLHCGASADGVPTVQLNLHEELKAADEAPR